MTSRALSVMALSACVAAASTGRVAAVEMAMPSCVEGSPPLRAAVDSARAMLGADDGETFQAAAQARYPMYRRGGWMAESVMLIRRQGRWQYVTLSRTGTGKACFTAVFDAERFDFTMDWIARYRPRAGVPAD